MKSYFEVVRNLMSMATWILYILYGALMQGSESDGNSSTAVQSSQAVRMQNETSFLVLSCEQQ